MSESQKRHSFLDGVSTPQPWSWLEEETQPPFDIVTGPMRRLTKTHSPAPFSKNHAERTSQSKSNVQCQLDQAYLSDHSKGGRNTSACSTMGNAKDLFGRAPARAPAPALAGAPPNTSSQNGSSGGALWEPEPFCIARGGAKKRSSARLLLLSRMQRR